MAAHARYTDPEAEPVRADDNRGWNRVSIIWHSKKPVSYVGPKDFVIPKLAGARMLGASLLAGLIVTLLHVWTTLMVVTIVAEIELGVWYPLIMATAPLAIGLAFYAYAVYETRRDRELADEL